MVVLLDLVLSLILFAVFDLRQLLNLLSNLVPLTFEGSIGLQIDSLEVLVHPYFLFRHLHRLCDLLGTIARARPFERDLKVVRVIKLLAE